MHEDVRRRLVCKGFCKFYKPGRKERLKCGTYDFLSRNLSPGELLHVCRGTGPHDLSRDEDIRAMICDRCEFLVDGCDFRDGLPSPPCGGYAVVESLLKRYASRKKQSRS
jgi:hypothetical protein